MRRLLLVPAPVALALVALAVISPCAPWCKTEDYWGLFWDLNSRVKRRFDAEGVSFPFPQRDAVHLEGGV